MYIVHVCMHYLPIPACVVNMHVLVREGVRRLIMADLKVFRGRRKIADEFPLTSITWATRLTVTMIMSNL